RRRHPELSPDPVTEPTGRAIRVLGKQHRGAGDGVGSVHSGVGADEAVTGLGDHEWAAPAKHPHRLSFHQSAVAVGTVVLEFHHRPLRLGHDLVGHHDDVVVNGTHGGESIDQLTGEVVARGYLPDPLDGFDLDSHRRRILSASVSASSAEFMRVGSGLTSTSGRSSSWSAESAMSITSSSSSPSYAATTPRVPAGKPRPSMTTSAGPLRGRPPIHGLTATTRPAEATASATPSSARMGQIERGGFDGPITTTSAVLIASMTPGAGDAPSTPMKRTSSTGARCCRSTK